MTLIKLIAAGYRVSIVEGELKIVRPNRSTVAAAKIKPLLETFLAEIAQALCRPLLLFSDHTTGHTPGHTQGRVTLHFIDYLSGEPVKAHFNANTRYTRSAGEKKPGDKLPRGQFTVGKRSKLQTVWRQLDLPSPRYPSEMREKLHHLKGLILTAELETKNDGLRPINKRIERANFSADAIKIAACQSLNGGKWTNSQQKTIGNPDREGIARNTVCERDLENSDYVQESLRVKNRDQRATNEECTPTPPQLQTTEKWIEAYGNE